MAKIVMEKKCNYKKCKHNGVINIDTDKFIMKGQNYYHEDCYNEAADLSLFRTMWFESINNETKYSDINFAINRLLKTKGITSNYLLFVLQYVIDNHYKLTYPAGFKYYVERKEIRDAYRRRNCPKIRPEDFSIKEDETDAPTFSIPKKVEGFGSILGGRR